MNKVNLDEKLSRFDDLWSPKIVASLNDYDIQVAKADGEFVWHEHAARRLSVAAPPAVRRPSAQAWELHRVPPIPSVRIPIPA